MANDNQIGLSAIFDDTDFLNGIAAYIAAISDADTETQTSAAEMEDSINGIGESVSETASETENSTSFMSDAFDGMAAVGAASFAAIGAGIAAMTAEMYLAVDAAMEVNSVMAELDFQIGKTGQSTGITKEQVLGLADTLSKVVPIDDEVITSAITMGMRFDGVTKDNIEPLIKAAADLSVSTGKDLVSSMRELALAVSDPDKAMRLLKDANITLTDAEMKTLKGFKDTGNAAGATAFLIDRINGKIGGLAETMGQTAKGKMTIMNTALGNMQETLGGPFIESLKGAFDRITAFASDPTTLAFLSNLGERLGSFANDLISKLPDVFSTVQTVIGTLEGIPTFFEQNEPIIIGILAAIGASMLSFGVNAAIGFAPIVAAAIPTIAILTTIAAVVAILYRAWTENWGGIQGKVANAWAQMQPVFQKLQVWLGENVPIAIEKLSKFWQETLLPAIQTAVIWIVDNVLPALVQIVQWLGTNVPVAIQALSNFWTNTLLPAIQKVWAWINTVLIPILANIVQWLSVNIPIAVQAMSDFWTNVLLPAIVTVANWISTVLIPTIASIAEWLGSVLSAAVSSLSAAWTNVLLPALTAIWGFISKFIIPLFQAIANYMGAVLGLAIRVLAGLWKNILLPALNDIWNYIKQNIIPIFESISGTINDNVRPVIDSFATWLSSTALGLFKPFSDWINNVLLAAWQGIQDAIQAIIDMINDLTNALNNMTLPDWLTPGSPTPFEMGLRGINEQLSKMAKATLPAVRYQMDVIGSVRDVQSMAARSSGTQAANVSTSNQNTNNYLFGARFSVENKSSLAAILQGSV